MNKKSAKQFCLRGHNTVVVGRNKNGACILCKKELAHARYQTNPDSFKEAAKNWSKNNLDKAKEINRSWYQKNKEKVNSTNKSRRISDIDFKLVRNLRNRLWMAIKNDQKKGSAVRDLGCSIPEFKQYIESKFYGNMTWKNYGSQWHLDHIKPLWKFDLTDSIQFKQAVHYTNLQPLTIEDHKKKTKMDVIGSRV